MNSRLVDIGSSSAEPFRALRLALELRSPVRRGNIVVFTSAEPGAGKSTIAANYAVVASFSQSSVLLIDGDLRRPVQHELFGTSRSPGLVDVIASDSTVTDWMRPVSGLSLSLLTAGSPFERSGDLVTSDRMASLLAASSSEFGQVIIDSPPILMAADATGFASHPGVDVVLVVDRRSQRRAVMRAVRRLQLLDANLLGIVMNREGVLSTYAY